MPETHTSHTRAHTLPEAAMMEHPFPRATSTAERCMRLMQLVSPEDTLGIVIQADPDAIASALALKRLFWRHVRRVTIYHTNPIRRSDNLALLRLLKIKLVLTRSIVPGANDKWAIVDSQPHHHAPFKALPFDIVIDHHPIDAPIKAPYIDIRETYGANSTILIEYLKSMNITPSPRLSTALFYGIKTDTENFVREALLNDMNAFQWIYPRVNMSIIKKIEHSEMTRKTLVHFREAMDRLVLYKDTALVYMGQVGSPDLLVVIADFFLKLAETTWSVVSGLYDGKLIVIFRNAGFRGDAGKLAQRLFLPLGASAGGHKSAARAEIPLTRLKEALQGRTDPGRFILEAIKGARTKRRARAQEHARETGPKRPPEG